MSSVHWQEWKAFSELEPFGEERMDYRMAAIEAALWNIARDVKRYPHGWPVTEFLLGFGDLKKKAKTAVAQTIRTQELLLDSWIAGSNLMFQREQRKGA